MSTMPRHIDADAVMRLIPMEELVARMAIANAPTADVVERKVGKWTERKVIEDGKAIEEWQSARCSVCGKIHTTPYLYYFNDFAYCPICGAEMSKGETDA